MRRLRDEGLLLACLSVIVAPAFLFGPFQMAQDGFLAVVAGKLIAHDGLPSHDTLTVLAQGRRWVDQQWLGQLIAYGSYALGGLRFVELLNGLCVTLAVGLAAAAARAFGGTARATAPIALLAAVTIAPIAYTIRTQTYAMPLFVAVLWLVLADLRSPSKRVFWTLPLLVLWCNVHGSIVLGVGIVGLRGLWDLRRDPPRGLLIVGVALVGLLASPYLPHLPDYYRDTIFNADFGRYVAEWQPTKLQGNTAAFFVLALVTIWLLARQRTSWFEKIVLLVLALNVLLAIRNLAWFGFAALIVVPGLAVREMPQERSGGSLGAVRLAAGAFAAVVIGASVLLQLLRTGDLSPSFPPQARAAVARAIAADPTARIYPGNPYGDWLLLQFPQVKGRVVYDSRLELLRRDELRDLVNFKLQSGTDWRRALHGARIVVLEERNQSDAVRIPVRRALLEQVPGARQLFRNEDLAVLALPTAPGGSPRR